MTEQLGWALGGACTALFVWFLPRIVGRISRWLRGSVVIGQKVSGDAFVGLLLLGAVLCVLAGREE